MVTILLWDFVTCMMLGGVVTVLFGGVVLVLHLYYKVVEKLFGWD
jgi:hypothetical protein